MGPPLPEQNPVHSGRGRPLRRGIGERSGGRRRGDRAPHTLHGGSSSPKGDAPPHARGGFAMAETVAATATLATTTAAATASASHRPRTCRANRLHSAAATGCVLPGMWPLVPRPRGRSTQLLLFHRQSRTRRPLLVLLMGATKSPPWAFL